MRACKIRRKAQGAIQHISSAFEVPFQQASAADIHPSIRIIRGDLCDVW